MSNCKHSLALPLLRVVKRPGPLHRLFKTGCTLLETNRTTLRGRRCVQVAVIRDGEEVERRQRQFGVAACSIAKEVLCSIV